MTNNNSNEYNGYENYNTWHMATKGDLFGMEMYPHIETIDDLIQLMKVCYEMSKNEYEDDSDVIDAEEELFDSILDFSDDPLAFDVNWEQVARKETEFEFTVSENGLLKLIHQEGVNSWASDVNPSWLGA
jgi:hypothetical protein